MLLKARILSLKNGRSAEETLADESPVTVATVVQDSTVQETHDTVVSSRRGKAPLVEPYTGENPDILWEEWLPIFERAASWNGWTEQERLLQLAGHLRGKALQEWSLLSDSRKSTFTRATAEMQNRLDPGHWPPS